jgi:hypothetical protein
MVCIGDMGNDRIRVIPPQGLQVQTIQANVDLRRCRLYGAATLQLT